MPLRYVRLTREAGDKDDVALALTQFDCCRDGREDEDPVAHEVNAFLRTDEWREGADLGVNTTYVFFDDDLDGGRIVGYVALAVDVVKLSAGERERLGRTNFPNFGAMRLVMLGVDSDFQGRGIGDTLLKWMVGKARELADEVAFRFVIADVNLVRKGWYDDRQFQVNRAEIYNPDEPQRSTISMRLDLYDVD